MRYSFLKCFVCIAGVSFACKLAAQDTTDVWTLSEVEVVGKNRPRVTQSAAPLQVLERDFFEKLGIQDLSEAVKRFSGVTVQDYGGIGGLKTVSVRGMGAKHTGVSYDGLPLSDLQSGQIDIGKFSLDNIESVSLAVGQDDDIFQAARMFSSSGTLKMRTVTPQFEGKPFNLRAQLKGGSFGLFNPALRYEQQLGEKWSASLSGSWQRADGDYPFTLVNGDIVEEKRRNNSDVDIYQTELNLYGDLGKGGSLRMKAYYYDSERGLPGSVVLYNDHAAERLWDQNFFGQVHYLNKINEKWSVQANGRFNWLHTRYTDIGEKYENGMMENIYYQREYYFSGAALYQPFESLSFSLAQDVSWGDLDNNFEDAQFPSRLTSLTALSAKYKTDRFTAVATLLGTVVKEKVEVGEKAPDKQRLSPSVSLSYRLLRNENLRLRFSCKDAFRLPTFNDLYYDWHGTPSLRPEKAQQFNLGLTWSGRFGSVVRYMSLTADAYYNKVKDKIVAYPTMFIWKMENMGTVDIKGTDINLFADLRLTDKLSLLVSGSYTFQKAVDVTDESDKNYKDQIPYTPRHSGSGSVSFENPWVNITYSLVGAGERYINPQNTEKNRIEPYVEQSLSANRTFRFGNTSFRLQVEVINLADKQYDIIKYYPMPGRSYRVSLVFDY